MYNIWIQLMHEFERPFKNNVLVLSVVLFIILISPLVFRRFRIPGIIGLIISGVMIGPHGFNLVLTQDIKLFSTLGMLYIMFIAGLELDLSRFLKNRHKSIAFGSFTFFIPISIGFPICYFVLGYDFNASFLTSSMFATHTLLSYPIVSRLGIVKSEIVAVAVGGTLLTDTAVLLILAVIKQNSMPQGLSIDFWLRLLVGLTFFTLVMIFVIPRLTKWFFKKLESEKHSHYIFVLAVVFFSAFLAEVAGVEPIIGAFAAGLVLNTLIPHSSALMNRIEYIGNALFIPFFLIQVGMLVDLKILFKGYHSFYVAFLLTVTAIVGKYVAAFVTQKLFKYNLHERNLLAGLSSAHAAATIAIILVGFNMGIIDEYILNGTIILILFTCLFASFITEKAGKKLVQSHMTRTEISTVLPFSEKILLPISNFLNFEKLLDFATVLKDKKVKNSISMLSVVTNDLDAEVNIANARKKIFDIKAHASASDTEVDFITTIDFNSGSGIARVSKEVMASTIVLGWPRQKGLIDKLTDEVLDQVLENTDKLVVITNTDQATMSYRQLRLFCPPLCELDPGFHRWLYKVNQLASELSLPVFCHCPVATEKAIQSIVLHAHNFTRFTFSSFEASDRLEHIASSVRMDEMIVLISARPGSIADSKDLESLPKRLESLFEKQHRIIFIP